MNEIGAYRAWPGRLQDATLAATNIHWRRAGYGEQMQGTLIVRLAWGFLPS